MNKLMGYLTIALLVWSVGGGGAVVAGRPTDNSNPPAAPVKLIFIHHSTGGNWLADPNPDQPYGGLGRALMQNNYFVSATNYGWGPDSIGDRTDIPNWPEWFIGPNSTTYLNALYHENSQNIGDFGVWPRLSTDPGGENTVIMFKSCFPNSDLEGNPNDPPLAEPNDWEYSVANAKAVYINILQYFATRQDKLFVVITAPPLLKSDTTAARAANARAFNNWLVNDWLQDYPYANVAVFDYYNVLTDPDNHHRWQNGRVEHVQAGKSNFSAYPGGDSHPNTEGHTKATAEFVPLLNVFYNRWKAVPVVAPTSTPRQAVQPTATATPTPAVEPSARPAEVIEDWEGENWWVSNGDGGKSTVTSDLDKVIRHGGVASLRSDYRIVEGGWGDTGIGFDEARDWSEGVGLSFWLHADEAGYPMRLVLYSGDPAAATPFEAEFFTDESHVSGWGEVVLPWEAFALASWADSGNLKTLDAARIAGVSFNFSPGQGSVWVDDLILFVGDIRPLPVGESAPMATSQPDWDVPASTPQSAILPTATPSPVALFTDTPVPVEPKRGVCGAGAVLLPPVLLAIWFMRRYRA